MVELCILGFEFAKSCMAFYAFIQKIKKTYVFVYENKHVSPNFDDINNILRFFVYLYY